MFENLLFFLNSKKNFILIIKNNKPMALLSGQILNALNVVEIKKIKLINIRGFLSTSENFILKHL